MSPYTYAEQLTAVQHLTVPINTSRRFNCPFCGGNKTLSITNNSGKLLWHCFRAACPVHGSAQLERDSSTVRELVRKTQHSSDKPFTLPDHFTNVLSEPQALRYLERNHCLQAYAKRLADIRWDPRQRRVVFLVKSQGVVVDVAGRSLDPSVKPKWYRYGSSSEPFLCGTSDVGVVVEDCASACAVSSVATGIALLGTNLQASHMARLRDFREVIVALDRDAAGKGLELQNLIRFYVPARAVILEDDLKYYEPEAAQRALGLAR